MVFLSYNHDSGLERDKNYKCQIEIIYEQKSKSSCYLYVVGTVLFECTEMNNKFSGLEL